VWRDESNGGVSEDRQSEVNVRSVLLVVLITAMATCANAGQNPNVRAYLDFDPPNYVHDIQPELYTTIDLYLCLNNGEAGVTSLSFRLSDFTEEYPGVFALPGWGEILWPSDLPICGPFMGMTIAAHECMQGVADNPAYRLSLFYLGGECCIRLLDHPDYPRWVVDCGEPYGEVDQYCVLAHASVGGAECPDGDCASVPVEGTTWGSIKGLYR
jgi:hypothetical protein